MAKLLTSVGTCNRALSQPRNAPTQHWNSSMTRSIPGSGTPIRKSFASSKVPTEACAIKQRSMSPKVISIPTPSTKKPSVVV